MASRVIFLKLATWVIGGFILQQQQQVSERSGLCVPFEKKRLALWACWFLEFLLGSRRWVGGGRGGRKKLTRSEKNEWQGAMSDTLDEGK